MKKVSHFRFYIRNYIITTIVFKHNEIVEGQAQMKETASIREGRE